MGLFNSLLTTAVAVVATPVAAVVDTVALPFEGADPRKPVYGRTSKMLQKVEENIESALDSDEL